MLFGASLSQQALKTAHRLRCGFDAFQKLAIFGSKHH
jgi:hypothetical protein